MNAPPYIKYKKHTGNNKQTIMKKLVKLTCIEHIKPNLKNLHI